MFGNIPTGKFISIQNGPSGEIPKFDIKMFTNEIKEKSIKVMIMPDEREYLISLKRSG